MVYDSLLSFYILYIYWKITVPLESKRNNPVMLRSVENFLSCYLAE